MPNFYRIPYVALALALPVLPIPVEAQQVGEVFRDCDVCPEMVVVPAGSFLMGSPDSEEGRDNDEGPQREVRVDYALAVGVYEVTFDEMGCMRARGRMRGIRTRRRGMGTWEASRDQRALGGRLAVRGLADGTDG